MAKPQRPKAPSSPVRPPEDRPLIPPKYQHAAALALLVLSLILYFNQLIFGGKAYVAADTIASHSFDTLLKDAGAAGVFPLWNPYIFCGMPAYGSLTITGNRWFDLTSEIFNFLLRTGSALLMNPSGGWVLVLYFIFAIGMYWFAHTKLQSKLAALVSALAATYSMYVIIWIMSGHNTKMAVMAMFPYIMLALDRLRQRFSFAVSFALVLALHLAFVASHIQMIFYIYLAVGLYLLLSLVQGFARKKEWTSVVRTGAVFALASVIAFAMDSDRYLSTLEYNPYSIRGAAPITESLAQAGPTKSVQGGLDYDYATNWSLAPGEMLTFIIPSAYGFGSVPYSGILSRNQEIRINTYFGPQPFTEAPQYMGIVVLVLAVIGLITHRRDPFVRYLAAMVGLSILIAFGRELPLLYDLMYNYFPTFNKFRAPSMILVLAQIMIPLLAGFGITTLFGLRDRTMPPRTQAQWKYVLGGLAFLLLVSLVASSVVVAIYEILMPRQEAVTFFTQRFGNPQVATELYKFVTDLVVGDVRVALALLLAAAGAMYLYVRYKVSLAVAASIVVVALVADLWRISSKPIEPQEQSGLDMQFATPPFVQFLQKDSTQFRVLELVDGQPPTSNTLAYWRIQSAFGYHGAKLRAYQDVVDVAGLNNPLVWQLMNVKYVVTDRVDSSTGLKLVFAGAGRYVYHNEVADPRVFFVDSIATASGLDILTNIRDRRFSPTELAYFLTDPGLAIDRPGPEAHATVSDFGIQNLSVSVSATGRNLLFLSETYYPEGWIAQLDGEEIPIFRANYLFRAVVIPPGEHTLTMTFEPRGFALGKNLSLGTNIVVLAGLAGVAIQRLRKWNTKPPGLANRQPGSVAAS